MPDHIHRLWLALGQLPDWVDDATAPTDGGSRQTFMFALAYL